MLINLNPEKWGKYFWIGLNFIGYAYPENPSDEDKQNVKNYIMSLGKVIPCDRCRGNFVNHLQKLPLDDIVLESRNNFINWLVNFHNEVNIMLEKRTISVNEYHNIMNDLLTKNNNSNSNNIIAKNKKTISVLILILIIIILIIYIKFK